MTAIAPTLAPANPDPLLTVNQAADYLTVSRYSVYEHIAAGRLKSLRIGRSRRIRQSALDAFLDAAGENTCE